MLNKTSGKQYLGQTTQVDMDNYRGSGGYWKSHCKKHGGWDRQNIQVLRQTWIVDKVQAQKWLDTFASENSEYWLRENTIWANACKETTEDNPFTGNKEVSSKGTKAGAKLGGKITGKKNVESGEWAKRQSAGIKTRAENLRLMSQFCKIFNVKSPGTGFSNVDKSSFQTWKTSLKQTFQAL
jgi:hypothetical protein